MFGLKNIQIGSLSISGSNIDIVGGKIFVDGKEVQETKGQKIEIHIHAGSAVNKIQSDQGLIVHGNVQGPVIATSVNCGDVNGNITAKSVNCDNVRGNIEAHGSVNCDKVTGSVTAKVVNT